MGKYKRIILLALFFSFIGVGFSNGLLFKKNKLVEEVIEYDEIVRKVKKSQRKPASIHSAKRAKTRPSVVADTFQPDLPKNLVDVVDENLNEADSSASLANPSEVQDSSNEKFTYLSGAHQGNQSAPYVSQGTLPNRAVAGANTINPSQFGAAVSGDSGPTYAFSNTNFNKPTTNATSIYKVKSITFKDGAFIIKGENLNTVRKITLNSSGTTSELEKISSTSSQVMAMGFNALKLIAGKTYSLIIADAYGSSSYPISVELADGSVTPRKFAPLGASEDGYILKWNASSQRWIAAPDEVGAGPDGGITSITKGAGIVGQGTSITTVGSIAVDVGSNAGQIPQFNADKKLVLQSDNRMSFTENAEEFVFGMFAEVFKLRNKTNDTDIFSVVGNDFLVRGQQVCLSDGTNCPAAGAAVESVSVSAPLTMSGTTSVSLGLAIDNTTIGLNGSSQLSIPNAAITANKLNQMGATPGQVLKWNGATWAPAVDTDTGITAESDPTVRKFARNDLNGIAPAACDADESMTYASALDTLVCQSIAIDASQVTGLNQFWASATGGINYADGRVGIGNTTPTEALDVTGVIAASSAMKVGSNTADTGSIRLSNTGSINWRNNSNTADVFGLRKDTSDTFFVGNGNLQLAAGGGTPTMYIGNNNSNVGIGTLTPSQKLEVFGGGVGITSVYPEIRFNETDTTGQGKVWRQVLDGKNLRFDLDVDGDGNMSPYTTVLQLNSTGNVGIGTLNPTAKLEVVGVVKATGFEGPMTSTSVSTGTGSAAAPAYSFSNSSSTGLFSSTAGTIGISSGGTHTFNFTSGGISSPTAGGASIASTAGVAANPTFSFAGDEDTGWYSPLADTFAASTAGVERMRIDASGRIGVGGVPQSKLSINDLYLNTTDDIIGLGLSIQGSLNDYGGITLWDRDGNAATTNDGDTTVYWGDDVADNLRFAYKGSGLAMSEKMRITPSGNVSIGTTSNNSRLTVESTANILMIRNPDNNDSFTGGTMIEIANTGVSTSNKYISFVADKDNDETGTINFGSMGLGANNSLVISNPTGSAVSLQPAGNVGIGVTAPTQKLEVNGSISSTLTADNSTSRNIYFGMASDTSNASNGYDAGDAWMVLNGGANSGRNRFVFAGNQSRTLDVNLHDGDLTLNSGRIGVGIAAPSEKIEVNGNVKAQAYLYTSDARLKKNVKTYDNALVKILALRGVKFDWIENDKPEVGFIAQEVEAIEPNLVVTSDIDGIKSVKYANMVAILVEAFKEQNNKIEENKKLFMVMHEGLELRVRKLEREIASLKEDNIKIKEENQRLKEDLELIKKHLKIK